MGPIPTRTRPAFMDIPTASTQGASVATDADGATRDVAAPPIWTRRRGLVLAVAYLAALGGMVLVKGVFISGDRYFLILLVPALVLGLGRPYIRDFLPFVVLILLYEQVRGLAHSLHQAIGFGPFYEPPIWLDRLLFLGAVPPEAVQQWLWTGDLLWYDQVLALLNRAHFFVPPTLLFLIWLERRDLFYRCAATLVAVSFAAAVVFLVFPVAPPWRASEVGDLAELVKIGSIQAASAPVETSRSLIASTLLRNPYAAVPSLHTGYSLLSLIFAFTWRRRVGLAFIPYTASMWFCIVYFADHYVADILAGAALALVGWWAVGRAMRPGGRLARLAGPFPAPLAGARLLER